MSAAVGSAGSIASVGPDTLDLPVIDLTKWFSREESDGARAGCEAECRLVADALQRFGILIVKDPRATEADNDTFHDMLEKYMGHPDDVKAADIRKELHYSVGLTPSHVELPRNHCERMKAFKDADKPISLCPPEKDAKGRFFWRLGERPTDTEFADLNAPNVIPVAFPGWADLMDTWGSKLLDAAQDVAEMAALGFGLPQDTFRSRMQKAPHLLAPTATDFSKFGIKGTILAGYHYDLCALTIHGRSRYPGLYIWTRDGSKKAVKIPAGCLLVQAGRQMEYITGGHVLAGFHEVVVDDAALAAIDAAKATGKSLWRISSTCFSHFASDVTLEPVGRFAELEGAKDKYPPIKSGALVVAELAAINLSVKTSDSTDVIAAL